MSRTGLAGIGLGTAAVVLSIVNLVRIGGAIDKLDQPGKGPDSPGSTASQDRPAPNPEDRAAEIAEIKKQLKLLGESIDKANIEIKNRPPVTGTQPPPDGEQPLPLTYADLGRVIEEVEFKEWKEARLRSAEFQIVAMQRGAQNRILTLEKNLNLKPTQKTTIEAILKSQIEGYAEVLRTIPPPDDRQERLDRVTKTAEEQINQQLDADQQKLYKQIGPGWHGMSQMKSEAGHRDSKPREKK